MGSAADEAKADARAALDQAKIVGQPYGSAIYFGVDFDVRDGTKDKNGKLVIESILDHFKIVKQTIGDEYRVGAYANGYVNRVLRDEGPYFPGSHPLDRLQKHQPIFQAGNGISSRTRSIGAGSGRQANARAA